MEFLPYGVNTKPIEMSYVLSVMPNFFVNPMKRQSYEEFGELVQTF